ncbi:hypothetical protein EDF88_0982 [Buttiauxella sp. BIGb0552]|uniref:hypothetical protein n=1 Tax=Buttiauxella sp. BIGb0552 TaxID=2485120 RepID=UPI0010649D96|nr:hypothetical protein [Buttiauxella sp. BIGb0552]TDX18496.1 hypothetical protein EDF88_0982 [Buttiauxella sp. BIGb0552]
MSVDYLAYETMQAAKETALYTYWIMLGTWLAGIATSAAVIITLYVTYNQKRVRLKFDVAERVVVSPLSVVGDANSTGISFTITNLSSFPVTVSKIGLGNFRFPWQESKYWFLKIDRHPLGNQLLMKIEQGEQCHLWIPLDDREDDWYKYLSEIISKADLTPNKMRVLISTTFGRTPRFKFSKQIQEKLNDAQKQIPKPNV